MKPGKVAENVGRMAGFHLVALETLAEYIGVSRVGLMKVLAEDGNKRGMPSTVTMMKLAGAFGVDLRTLMEDDPAEVMRALMEGFERAPIREVAKVPSSELRVTYSVQIETRIAEDEKVTPIRPKRKGRR